MSAQEKTEAATPRQLSKARERGEVSKSADLTASLVLAAGVGAVGGRADEIGTAARGIVEGAVGRATGGRLDVGLATASLGEAAAEAAGALAPC